MALDTNIVGTNLDAGSNVKVALTNTPAYTGSVRLMSENDPGTLTSGVPYLKSPETSNDFRLRTGSDTMLFQETFNTGSLFNTNNWFYSTSTTNISSSSSGTYIWSTGTAANTGSLLRSWNYFPINGTSPLSVEITAGFFTAPFVANEIMYIGLGNASAGNSPLTEGIYIKVTSAGIQGEMCYNNTTTTSNWTLPWSSITIDKLYRFVIVIGEDEAEFWIENNFLGDITVPTSQGQPFQQTSLPIVLHKFHTGAVSNTNTVRVSDVTVLTTDLQYAKPYSHIQSACGLSSHLVTLGNAVSTAAPVTQFAGTITTGSSPLLITGTAGSNTAANVTGLGGIGGITAPVAAATDLICTNFLNPAPSINITGRNLYITGISISVINTGATVATTPTTLLWSIGYGQTTVSMNTTESGFSFVSGTAHAPRRMQLGFMSAPIGAVIGQPYDKDIVRTFQTPILVRPNEYINTYIKVIVGTATASQVILYNVLFDGYWE